MIAIVEQVARRLVPRKRLAQLLGRPLRCRVCGDGNVADASPVVGEERQEQRHHHLEAYPSVAAISALARRTDVSVETGQLGNKDGTHVLGEGGMPRAGAGRPGNGCNYFAIGCVTCGAPASRRASSRGRPCVSEADVPPGADRVPPMEKMPFQSRRGDETAARSLLGPRVFTWALVLSRRDGYRSRLSTTVSHQ